MMKKLLIIVSTLSFGIAFGQYEISGTTEQTIDFNAFDGSGFASAPASGQLDSDDWKITEMSEGDLEFGDTRTSGDYARGTSTGSVSTGGVYAFDIGTSDFILGVQPGGSDFSPGTIVLRVQNKTGATITSLDISYEIYDFNDQSKSNSLNFSHGADDVSYTDESSLDFTTIEAEDSPAAWLKSDRSIALSVSIAANDEYYLRWLSDEVSGTGSMDQLGIDDVKITATTSGGPTKIVGFESESSLELEINSNFNTTIPVTLENYDNTQVDLSVTVTGGSAESGDYTLNTPTLSFTASETKNISIDINSDADVFDETIEITIAETSSEGYLVSPAVHTISISDDEAPSLIINEIHSDPDVTNGDSNGDGAIDSGDDEFFEIVNTGDVSIDIGDWVMSDVISDRHVFTTATVLAPNQAIVVFGGGTPTGSFGDALVQTASTGSLSLNNAGDDIILRGSEGTEVLTISYGSIANDDQSITLNPDLTGSFERHSTADTDDNSLYSPGTRIDGSSFVPITWDGSEEDQDWSNPDNWDSGTVPTSADNVVIADVSFDPIVGPFIPEDFAVNNLTINTGGNLSITSGSSLAIFGTVTNNGTYSVDRNSEGGAGYSILSSPVVSETINDLTLADYAYSFDGTSFSSNLAGSSEVMNPGQGYFIGSDDSSPTMTFSGTPNSGTITHAVTSGNFELVGNPYSAAISISDFLIANSSVINGAVYFWDDGGSNSATSGKRGGDYITTNGMGTASAVEPDGVTDDVTGSQGTGGAINGNITSTQGIFVEANATGNVSFTPSMQVTESGANDDSNHYRVEEIDYQKVKLAISGNGLYNEVLVGLGEDASYGRDAHLDAKKFVTNNSLSFYSLIEDEKYVIQGLPLANLESVSSSLGFDVEESGTFTMSVVDLENIPENLNVVLVDHMTSSSYDLKTIKSFDFTTAIVKNDKRFELVFNLSNVLSVESLSKELTVFGSSSEMTILFGLEGEQEVFIYSLDGKAAFSESVIFKNEKTVIRPRLTRNKVYILQVGDDSFKFVIK